MIFTLLFSLLPGLFFSFLGLFPDADVTALSQLNLQVLFLKNILAGLDWLIPVNTFFLLLGIIVVVESGIFALNVIRYLMRFFTLGIFK
jgi:hypothetical protein